MLKVGITGGIGSGKTTITKVFEILGAPVLHADIIAKKIMEEDEVVKKSIIDLLGPKSYESNKINTPYISSIVFNNASSLASLNKIVHPATIAYTKKWMSEQTYPYALKEAALIFESQSEKEFDVIIGVFAPASIRLHRAMKRDQVSQSAIEARMTQQLNEEEKMSKCDYVITNDEKESVIKQVMEIHEKLLILSATKN